jgi:aromatic-L-amino-acid decarboxylase
VRDPATLRAAHSGDDAHYLQDIDAADLPDFADLGPELTRPFRGLPLWLPLHLHGVAAFRDALDEKLDLTQRITASLRADPNLEVGWHPQLTVVAFRIRGGDEERSRQLLDRINATKRVFLSSTLIRGEYWLRVCIVSHRTHVDRIDECATIVRDAAAALA